jgi:3-phosphoshikimate 1-carboxyvinyltransferase
MGASIDEANGRPDDGIGEPTADLVARSSTLEAIELGPADVAAAIDEIPILCLAATQARGTTVIRGVGELRHKESDRLAGIAAGLAALGADVEIRDDELRISGPTDLHGAVVDSLADHRLAMTFAIAGLIARGETVVLGSDSASISYPGFFDELRRVAT